MTPHHHEDAASILALFAVIALAAICAGLRV